MSADFRTAAIAYTIAEGDLVYVGRLGAQGVLVAIGTVEQLRDGRCLVGGHRVATSRVLPVTATDAQLGAWLRSHIGAR
jgi:hypothetical protein